MQLKFNLFVLVPDLIHIAVHLQLASLSLLEHSLVVLCFVSHRLQLAPNYLSVSPDALEVCTHQAQALRQLLVVVKQFRGVVLLGCRCLRQARHLARETLQVGALV